MNGNLPQRIYVHTNDLYLITQTYYLSWITSNAQLYILGWNTKITSYATRNSPKDYLFACRELERVHDDPIQPQDVMVTSLGLASHWALLKIAGS
jgi:hypothetical protein